MQNIKVIRKYSSSRALYDTEDKKTIRQKDLPKIIEDKDIIIYNDKGQDITLNTLLTILASENYNNDHNSILSEKILFEIIRNSNNELSSFFNMFLERYLDFFVENKELFKEIIKNQGAGELFNLLNNLGDIQRAVIRNYKKD